MHIKKALLTGFFLFLISASAIQATEVSKYGVHIMNPSELESADQLLDVAETDQWQYVTIPFTFSDTLKLEQWQRFFDQAEEKKIIPLVRLSSEFDGDAWVVPNRKQLVLMITALDWLDWPTEEQHIIVFNEVNHAKEWGGSVDPAGYADTLAFAANWAHTENENFVVLPAAMDLAAPNGQETQEAFAYLDKMIAARPEVLTTIDAWNSHSYPNPAFSASPQKTGQNSLRGFEHELAYLKDKTGQDYDVYITETGWDDNATTNRWLSSYYTYAMQHIWSDARVKAVTPFVLKGAPGPFAGFSFLSASDVPTTQYQAFRNMLEMLAQQHRLLTDAEAAE